ncbi:MAG: hypothetical protein A4E71_02972 [Smithella sp. PtaU1.Bin162]|nr:MAG: hypothetical protein A4E71_02972 [Smithella sp. PtaU1.Bin162]
MKQQATMGGFVFLTVSWLSIGQALYKIVFISFELL